MSVFTYILEFLFAFCTLLGLFLPPFFFLETLSSSDGSSLCTRAGLLTLLDGNGYKNCLGFGFW